MGVAGAEPAILGVVRRALLLLALTACARVDVQSPPDGSVVRVPWVPLVVRAPERFAGGSATVLLDGEPFPDPLLLTRRDTDRGTHPRRA